MLQWGRVRSDAESAWFDIELKQRKCFNGAASRSDAESEGRVDEDVRIRLQWGRVRSDAESVVYLTATGPKGQLQWGRVRWTRNRSSARRWRLAAYMLQWGRVRSDAESFPGGEAK